MLEETVVQLSAEHNAGSASARDEFHLLHPDDPKIFFLKKKKIIEKSHNVWHVKGPIQVIYQFRFQRVKHGVPLELNLVDVFGSFLSSFILPSCITFF